VLFEAQCQSSRGQTGKTRRDLESAADGGENEKQCDDIGGTTNRGNIDSKRVVEVQLVGKDC